MFTRKLHNADPSKATTIPDPAAPNYRLGDYSYGKEGVRVFQLKKDGPLHSVTEYKVQSHMRLRTHKEYYEADNSDIIGSDVQENTIYVHAQRHGLHTPEEFALTLTEHFLQEYDLVAESNVIVEELAWDRFGEQERQGYYKDKRHNHAFMRNTNGTHSCEVVRRRDAPPLLIGNFHGLRIVKTARAPFTGYVKGDLYSEGDMDDRILCTEVQARWQYSKVDGIDFSTHWLRVRDLILRSFAGDPVEGVVITSVQYAAYTAERAVLDAMPEICSIAISFPNYRHFPFDFSRFPPIEPKADVIIVSPQDTPLGIGYAQLDRLEE
ncbi:PREDICTED: uricase-like [Rhagoletis zephyria]|uniref:uricase-like n=1 Tax=Rhagoletis zephyria TaxID=28612 RepID=UPI0008113ECF|nr:PREDICTED: uricase-like [Rhagoletis zephyria]